VIESLQDRIDAESIRNARSNADRKSFSIQSTRRTTWITGLTIWIHKPSALIESQRVHIATG
jgi:hypothetical protein